MAKMLPDWCKATEDGLIFSSNTPSDDRTHDLFKYLYDDFKKGKTSLSVEKYVRQRFLKIAAHEGSHGVFDIILSSLMDLKYIPNFLREGWASFLSEDEYSKEGNNRSLDFNNTVNTLVTQNKGDANQIYILSSITVNTIIKVIEQRVGLYKISEETSKYNKKASKRYQTAFLGAAMLEVAWMLSEDRAYKNFSTNSKKLFWFLETLFPRIGLKNSEDFMKEYEKENGTRLYEQHLSELIDEFGIEKSLNFSILKKS